MNVSNGMDMIAEGFLWSTVIMSHRSTGMLSQSWFTLPDRQERWTVAQVITRRFRPFPITSQEHVKQSGIWEGQSSRNDWNSLMGLVRQTDFRRYLHSNWNLFSLIGFVFQSKEQTWWGELQTTWMNKNLTCNAKNKQETFFSTKWKEA